MKKILLLITRGEVGGAQMVVLQLAAELKKRGHHITVGVGANTGTFLPEALMSRGIRTIFLKHLGRTYNPFSAVAFYFEIKKLLARESYDVLHLHSSNTIIAACAAWRVSHKPKILFTLHGLSFLHPAHRHILKPFVWYAFKWCIPYMDEVIFVTRNDYDYARAHGLVRHGTVIYNATTTTFFSRDEARAALGLQLNEIVVGSIGRLAYPKNYEFFVRAMRRIPQATSIIIGDGPERNHYLNRVRLTGELPDAARYLLAFDLFVLPSLYEGCSLTLIDALKAGIPILASNVGGNAEVVASPEQLFTVHDEEEFITKATAILNNSDYAQQLGAENKKNGERFSLDTMMRGYTALL